MKKIYIAVVMFLFVSVLLFVLSFLYLDKVNHRTFHYVIQTAGKDTGTIKVERFVTEGKIIFKSVTNLPFEPVYTEYRSRLVLDKKYSIESYTRERAAFRATEMIYLENFKNLISFVSRYQSKFACADNIPIRKETFVFEEDSPATYLPVIENYDFSKGHSQGFNAISCVQAWNLPPMKRFITLTSIRDEYIKIDFRKIKTENLLLKIRDYPQGALWVGKSDRTVMKLEIPAKNLTVTRTFRPRPLKAAVRKITPDGYASKDISFKSKTVELSGTLTSPLKDGKFPAILFAPGAGPQDRDYQGLFASLADRLSMGGFVTLRFDKRGIGSSGGEFSSSTDSDDIEDLRAALQYLALQNMVDPGAIILIGHTKGAIDAMKVSMTDNNVRGLIMMAPPAHPNRDRDAIKEELLEAAQKAKWANDYISLVIRAAQETQAKVDSSSGSWVYVLGKKCFLGGMKDNSTDRPPEGAGSHQFPVLTLQGRDTGGGRAVDAGKTVIDEDSSRYTLTYYAYLDQYFGQKINDGVHRYYYDVDGEVLENIRTWLDKTLSSEAEPVPPTPAALLD